jgi:hypothetical protein
VLIRRDPCRTRRLREAGVAVAELGFGGVFDLASRLAFRREIARWRPTIVLSWMNGATQLCPPGDFIHVDRLGGYYDLKYYRRCDHLIANTRALVDYAAAAAGHATESIICQISSRTCAVRRRRRAQQRRPEAVETLFAAAGQKRAGRAAWTLLFYALWHRAHIERAGLPPDTLVALAEAA